MSKLFIVPLCLLSLFTNSLAIIGRHGCTDTKDGCYDCAKKYTISYSHVAIPSGCHKSKGGKNGNALPYNSLISYDKGKIKINKKMWYFTGDAAQIISELCGKYALQWGFDYFGIENESECYFGFEDDINGQGLVEATECARRCKWDVGTGNHMMLFKVQKMDDVQNM